jgi:hypothetical protein
LAALVADGLAADEAARRVVVFRAVDFRGVAFGLAVPEAFGVAAALGAADGAADGVEASDAAAVAAFALPAGALLSPPARVDFGLAVLVRRRTPVAEPAGFAWRSFTPVTRAASSRTSAVTSARRTVRFSRFLLVA